jgi:hypothetical protein
LPRPRFSKASEWGIYPDFPADEHYELAEGELDEAALPGYSSKELVIWGEGNVYMTASSGKQQVLAMPRDQAVMLLAPKWGNYIHKGSVAARPGGTAPNHEPQQGNGIKLAQR